MQGNEADLSRSHYHFAQGKAVRILFSSGTIAKCSKPALLLPRSSLITRVPFRVCHLGTLFIHEAKSRLHQNSLCLYLESLYFFVAYFFSVNKFVQLQPFSCNCSESRILWHMAHLERIFKNKKLNREIEKYVIWYILIRMSCYN